MAKRPRTYDDGYGDDGEDNLYLGGGGLAATMVPMQVGGGSQAGAPSMFQQSINRQRAREASKAASFAAAAPIPTNSAYGSPQLAQAARNAFIGDQRAVADMTSGNFFQNRMLVGDYNSRANAQSGANVGLMGSVAGANNATAYSTKKAADVLMPADAAYKTAQSRELDARSTILYPAQGKEIESNAARNNADATIGVPARAAQNNATAAQGNATAQSISRGDPATAAALKEAKAQLVVAQRRINSLEGTATKGSDDGKPRTLPADTPPGIDYSNLTPGAAAGAAGASYGAPTTPAQAGTATQDDQVYVNPKTGQKIRRSGSGWVTVQ